MNIAISNKADVTKIPDYGNRIIAWPDNKTDSLKKPVSLDGVVRALNRANTRANNKVDMKVLDKANTGGNNGVSMIVGIESKDGIVVGVKSKVDNRVFLQIRLTYSYKQLC